MIKDVNIFITSLDQKHLTSALSPHFMNLLPVTHVVPDLRVPDKVVSQIFLVSRSHYNRQWAGTDPVGFDKIIVTVDNSHRRGKAAIGRVV